MGCRPCLAPILQLSSLQLPCELFWLISIVTSLCFQETSTVCCPEYLLSAVRNFHCPLSGISTVRCQEYLLSAVQNIHCPLSGISTVRCPEYPLSAAWNIHCPLSGISTVRCPEYRWVWNAWALYGQHGFKLCALRDSFESHELKVHMTWTIFKKYSFMSWS